jgi:hypothetical protein
MFNPETAELYRINGKDYASWADFQQLREHYREALDCLLQIARSNTEANVVLHKAGLNGH